MDNNFPPPPNYTPLLYLNPPTSLGFIIVIHFDFLLPFIKCNDDKNWHEKWHFFLLILVFEAILKFVDLGSSCFIKEIL